MSYNLDVSKIKKEEWLLANCKERSLYILSKYSKTEKELRDKLKSGKKYDDETIDKTIEFLKKHKYIDDEAFVKRYFEIHKNNNSYRQMKNKLFIKGIKKDLIDRILLDEFNDEKIDESNTIKKLLLKKYPNYYKEKDNMDIKEKNKVFSYLARKGFSYDDISTVLREIID